MQTTTRTIEYPVRETQPLPRTKAMPTSMTRLAGISGVDSNDLAGGPFCLHLKQLPEPRPCRVRDGLTKTLIMQHPVDFQILKCNKPEAVDYPTGMLVREIVPTPTHALMHTGHYFPALSTGGRTLLLFREKALDFCQGLFLSAKEAWVLNLLTRRESSKRFEANVYTDLLRGHRQSSRLPLTGEGSIPLTRRGTPDTYSLGGTFQWAMKHYLYRPNFGQVKAVTDKVATTGSLRVAQTIVSAVAPKAWVAWFLTLALIRLPYSTEKCLESKVYSDRDILQDLTMNRTERGAVLLEGGKEGVLVIQGKRFFRLLVSILALCKQVVVQPATFLKHITHLCGLFMGRVYPVQKGFTQLPHYCTEQTSYQPLARLTTANAE